MRKYSMLRRALVTALAVLMPLCLLAQEETNSRPKLVLPLRPLFESLRRANVSGSLEFSGRCSPWHLPDWPRWRNLTFSDGNPLQIARETFADDTSIVVTQESDGKIRMIQKSVPTDLLELNISRIQFWDRDFSAHSAARAILHSPSVQSYMKGHNILTTDGEAVYGGTPSYKDPPHTALSMENVTIAQAMDRILKTFPGLWVYEDCILPDGKSRYVWFSFFGSGGPGPLGEE